MRAADRLLAVLIVAAYLAGSAYTVGAFWNRIECSRREAPLACTEGMIYASIATAVVWPFVLSAILQDNDR
jgi:uncharacterized membrane protein YidH (DUF202 family)